MKGFAVFMINSSDLYSFHHIKLSKYRMWSSKYLILQAAWHKYGLFSHILSSADTQTPLNKLFSKVSLENFFELNKFWVEKCKREKLYFQLTGKKKKRQHSYSSEGTFIAVLTTFKTTATCLISWEIWAQSSCFFCQKEWHNRNYLHSFPF